MNGPHPHRYIIKPLPWDGFHHGVCSVCGEVRTWPVVPDEARLQGNHGIPARFPQLKKVEPSAAT